MSSSFNSINQNQMSGCNKNHGQSQNNTPINAPNYNPFKPRPKIDQYHQINGSPIINSYFIPNTPSNNYSNNHNNINYNINHNKQVMMIQEEQEKEQEHEEEPGSTKPLKRRKKRRRSSGISSQPEGIYSPVPKAKILDELNQSINGLYIDNDEKSEEEIDGNDTNNSSFVIPSELRLLRKQNSNDIRNMAIQEFEKMDKAIDADLSLLNESSITNKLSHLHLANDHRNYHETPRQRMDVDVDGYENNMMDMNEEAKFIYIEKDGLSVKQLLFTAIEAVFNKDIYICFGGYIINFGFIVLLLLIYALIIDFQWK